VSWRQRLLVERFKYAATYGIRCVILRPGTLCAGDVTHVAKRVHLERKRGVRQNMFGNQGDDAAKIACVLRETK